MLEKLEELNNKKNEFQHILFTKKEWKKSQGQIYTEKYFVKNKICVIIGKTEYKL